MSKLDELRDQLLKLPASSRADFARELLGSLSDADLSGNLEKAWEEPVEANERRQQQDSYELTTADHGVEFWSSRRLPFEPRGTLSDARSALRLALEGLDVVGSLIAEYSSLDQSFCDIENVLLYNVGMRSFQKTGANHIVLRRRYTQPPDSPSGRLFDHHHRYAVVTSPTPRVLMTRARRDFSLPAVSTASGFWLAARSAASSSGNRLRESDIGVRITLSMSETDRRSLPSVLKPVLDGIVASMHRHDGSQLDEVAARLADQTGRAVEEIRELLMTGPAELGTRTLIRPIRDATQWNPADDWLSEIEISLTRADGRSCVAEFYECEMDALS